MKLRWKIFFTDDTLVIVEKYAELNPSKVRILARQKRIRMI
jgi:hypothetical protein